MTAVATRPPGPAWDAPPVRRLPARPHTVEDLGGGRWLVEVDVTMPDGSVITLRSECAVCLVPVLGDPWKVEQLSVVVEFIPVPLSG